MIQKPISEENNILFVHHRRRVVRVAALQQLEKERGVCFLWLYFCSDSESLHYEKNVQVTWSDVLEVRSPTLCFNWPESSLSSEHKKLNFPQQFSSLVLITAAYVRMLLGLVDENTGRVFFMVRNAVCALTSYWCNSWFLPSPGAVVRWTSVVFDYLWRTLYFFTICILLIPSFGLVTDANSCCSSLSVSVPQIYRMAVYLD